MSRVCARRGDKARRRPIPATPDRPPVGTVGRVYANLAKLLGGKAAAGLLSLVYMILAARALGPLNYGVLVLVHGFTITVGGVIAFPGWHAIVRFGAEAQACGDEARLTRLLRFTGTVEAVGGVCAVAAAALLGPILGPRLGWTPPAVAFAVPYSLAVLASIRATPAGYLQLMGRFDLIGLHNMVAPLVRLAGAIVVVAGGGGLNGFLVAWLVAALAEWMAMWALGWWVAHDTHGSVLLRGGVAGVRSENPGIWRFMLAANADLTLTELAGRIAPLVIGWVLNPAAAGLFAVAQRATTVIAQPAQILGQAAYAELARLVAAGGRGRPLGRALARCLSVAGGAAAPVVVILVVWREPVAELMGGAAFAGAGGVLGWLAVSRGILLAGPPASAALTALGRPVLSVAVNLATNLGLLPLLPLLLVRHGLAGAGWFTFVQSIVSAALLLGCVWHANGGREAVR